MSFQTADLCDEFGDKVRVLDPLGLISFGGKNAFCGEVVTLKAFEDNSLVRKILETPGTGKVLVIDGGASNRCAMVGDQLAELGVNNGWEGILVHGRIRDSRLIGTMNIGVFALGTHPRKTEKRNLGDQGVTLRFGGQDIAPGSYIYADEDGVLLCDAALN